MPWGPTNPNQAVTSKPGKPLSATVGTSGIQDKRLAEVTASNLILPPLAKGIALGALGNMKVTSFFMTEFTASGEPLKGT